MANKIRISANQDEITFYCFVGEAICKIQHVEQALNCSITIKMNPEVTREIAEDFFKQQQRLTLGQAIKLLIKEDLYPLELKEELNNFLVQRNWLVYKAIFESRNDFYNNDKKEQLFRKIKSISDKAENLQDKIQYDMINFSIAKGKDMSKIVALLELERQGVRIQN